MISPVSSNWPKDWRYSGERVYGMSSPSIMVSASPTNAGITQQINSFFSSPVKVNMKRRNSASSASSSSDYQSLQSSLKRVRLSCSPGELRLQRDLRDLIGLGWHLIGSDNENLDVNSISFESNPRWYLPGGTVPAEVHFLDAHRLVLHLKLPTDVGRIWIQVPRMYPHRPPTVSRIERLWMDQIVIHEAPPSGKKPPSNGAASRHSKVLLYNDWSPVQNLGTLLQFLVDNALHATGTVPSQVTSPCNSTASSRATSPQTTLPHHPPNYSSSSSSLSSSHTNAAHDLSTNQLQTHIVEEHKMEESHTSQMGNSFDDAMEPVANGSNKMLSPFAPNRFDMGYGRYQDLLSLSNSQGGANGEHACMMATDAPMPAAHSHQFQDMAMEMS